MSALAKCVLLAALAPGLCLGAGCGGGDDPLSGGTAAAPATEVSAAVPRYLPALELERDLSNGVRQGLYRLAVMSQPPDDASDVGQQLPTGSVTGVRCASAGARPSDATSWPWRCDVRWTAVDGGARRTRYAVQLLPTGCFAAGATPPYPAHRDTTIASYSEHPLNALASVRKGC